MYRLRHAQIYGKPWAHPFHCIRTLFPEKGIISGPHCLPSDGLAPCSRGDLYSYIHFHGLLKVQYNTELIILSERSSHRIYAKYTHYLMQHNIYIYLVRYQFMHTNRIGILCKITILNFIFFKKKIIIIICRSD